MSKTIVIMDTPDNAKSIEQIGDENHYFLGAFGEVITALRQVFPEADFSDPTKIIANTDKGIVTVEISKHTPVQSFMLHLEKDEAVELVLKLCKRTKWRALDTDTGQFIDQQDKTNKDTGIINRKSWWKFWNHDNS
jgi:ArsR family metal-binding transcriptional regulator